MFFTATMIRAFRSARSRVNGGTNTFAYFARNVRCTVTTDLLVWYSNTQYDSSPGATIFLLHTLASPSGRNENYDEKQFTEGGLSCSFYLYRFRKYVSYGFPIINFCNPGVHYWNALCGQSEIFLMLKRTAYLVSAWPYAIISIWLLVIKCLSRELCLSNSIDFGLSLIWSSGPAGSEIIYLPGYPVCAKFNLNYVYHEILSEPILI